MSIKHVMAHAARTVEPETPVCEAAQRLRESRVPTLVVLEGESVAGIVTEFDIVTFVAESLEPHPVESIVRPVATVSPKESIRDAAETMRAEGVKHLPVVQDGCYRGLVSASMLAPYLSRCRLEIDWNEKSVRIDGENRADNCRHGVARVVDRNRSN